MDYTEEQAETVRSAFKLDMRDATTRGETWRWYDFVVLAQGGLVLYPDSVLRPVYAEILAADALIRLAASGRGVAPST